MKKAVWNGKVVAESDQTIVIEGNHYFPPDSVNQAFLEHSDHHTTCPWKGHATYFDVVVEGEVNANSAWTYPAPKEIAKEIRDYVAFWRGVKVMG